MLLVVALRRHGLPRWMAVVGIAAAALIATGVFVPVLHLAGLSNFIGYVLWCGWVLVLSGLMISGRLVHGRAAHPTAAAVRA
jgi:hypothetical protein